MAAPYWRARHEDYQHLRHGPPQHGPEPGRRRRRAGSAGRSARGDHLRRRHHARRHTGQSGQERPRSLRPAGAAARQGRYPRRQPGVRGRHQRHAGARQAHTFRAHPRTLPLLKRHFDALALANNHSGDYGPLAFGEMLDLLDKQGIAYFGGGRTLAAAHKPLIIERKGLRIALLGYDEFFPRSFEADVDKPGIAWSEDEQVRLDIATARSTYHADLVIPMMHWGWEHEGKASQRQRQLARVMIDAGADAVVGGHPHVTQDVEQYKGKPIIYSLGNFLFDGFSDAVNNTGWILEMQ